MPRIPFTARAAALAVACAVGAPAAIATAASLRPAATPAVASGSTVRTPASAKATIVAGGDASVAPTSQSQGFLGIATSFSTLPVLAGSAGDPDIAFRNLLSNLSPGAPFQLRLGGVSADDSWWPIRGVKASPYLQRLTPQMAKDIRTLLVALHGKAILGINLEQAAAVEPTVARTEVADFTHYVGAGRISAFELGNEPEFWPLSLIVPGARGKDTIPAYGQRFTQTAHALPKVPLAGPASVGVVWQSKLGSILSHVPHLKFATVHMYPLKNCSRAADPLLSELDAPSSIRGLAKSAHAMVQMAHAHHTPLRIDELNAITCGGRGGVSNSYGEALWALNALPALWGAGVQGVNYQTVDGGFNQIFSAAHTRSGWRVGLEPVYYGLLAFAQAAPAGSHLLRISDPGLSHFYQFAVRAPDGSERVVLTNVGTATRTVGVSARGAHGPGTLSLLDGRALNATGGVDAKLRPVRGSGGVTLGGQTVSSRTGELTGAPKLTTITPNGHHVYEVRVPAHAAAILTVG